jgi:hypothetical protein
MMPSPEERLILTGILGDAVRESAQSALAYAHSSSTRRPSLTSSSPRRIRPVALPRRSAARRSVGIGATTGNRGQAEPEGAGPQRRPPPRCTLDRQDPASEPLAPPRQRRERRE